MRKIYFAICMSLIAKNLHSQYDLTIIGPMLFSESLSGISGSIINCLKNKLKINYIYTTPANFQDMPLDIKAIAQGIDKRPGNVTILTDILWHTGLDAANLVPNSKIKLAYSMLESTAIPTQWVNRLNRKFDAVVVPDIFFLPVYKKSGVKIPIFVLPCILALEEFLQKPIKTKANPTFLFGMSALASEHKNFELLIRAFARYFKNNPKVRLVLHDRTINIAFWQKIKAVMQELQITNVDIILKRFNRKEYIDFMSSIDCYVLLSKGEGFSITPREALALGIPCILSNNTAQITICNTNFVKKVESSILEPAQFLHLGGKHGHMFNCNLTDAANALKDVYDNYAKYLILAKNGREWIKQYLSERLHYYYLNLVKPQVITLGKENKITANQLITNSLVLYKKYLAIQGK